MYAVITLDPATDGLVSLVILAVRETPKGANSSDSTSAGAAARDSDTEATATNVNAQSTENDLVRSLEAFEKLRPTSNETIMTQIRPITSGVSQYRQLRLTEIRVPVQPVTVLDLKLHCSTSALLVARSVSEGLPGTNPSLIRRDPIRRRVQPMRRGFANLLVSEDCVKPWHENPGPCPVLSSRGHSGQISPRNFKA